MSLSHLEHKATQVFQKFRITDSCSKNFFFFMSMSEDLFLFQDSKHFREFVLYKKKKTLLKPIKLSVPRFRTEGARPGGSPLCT